MSKNEDNNDDNTDYDKKEAASRPAFRGPNGIDKAYVRIRIDAYSPDWNFWIVYVVLIVNIKLFFDSRQIFVHVFEKAFGLKLNGFLNCRKNLQKQEKRRS